MVPYLGYLFSCVTVVCTYVFSPILELFFFLGFFFSLFFLILQYCDVEYISATKRAKGLSNAVSKEREFSVSLETKKLVFLSLHKRQNVGKRI